MKYSMFGTILTVLCYIASKVTDTQIWSIGFTLMTIIYGIITIISFFKKENNHDKQSD